MDTQLNPYDRMTILYACIFLCLQRILICSIFLLDISKIRT